MKNEDKWFRPKLFGWGITPVTWQGWALTLGFTAALLAAFRWLPTRTEQVIVALALFAAFYMIAAGKTDGELGCHWGSKDDR